MATNHGPVGGANVKRVAGHAHEDQEGWGADVCVPGNQEFAALAAVPTR